MSQRQNRTDRAIIAVALLILLFAGSLFYFDSWMWGARRNRGDRIGTIVAKNGDVRLKFEGDLKWQKAARGQDLVFNDSVYSGSGSQASLQLGETEMTVTENTLIVLRREKKVNFLNLDYGTLFGKIAKNEKVVIDTGSGKPVELVTTNAAQIVLRKQNGKTELDVLAGEAEMTVDGKTSRLSKSTHVVVDDQSPGSKVEQVKLVAIKPLKDQTVYSDQPGSLAFEWAWSNHRDVKPNEKFVVEFSATPAFQTLHTTKAVTGATRTTMSVSKTLHLYYRVRGPHGELSQVEMANFVRIDRPYIVKPLANQQILTPPGQNALVEFEFRRPEKTNTWFQIASDPDFNDVLINQNTAETRKVQELAVGTYFVRARSDYGQEKTSQWSETVPFKVEPKLDILRLTDVRSPQKILIPNKVYPVRLYNAPSAVPRDYLAQQGFLNNYFPFAKDSFGQITMVFEGQKEPVVQSTTAWPTRNLKPGRYTYRYQVTKLGHQPTTVSEPKKLEIAMEPPRALGEASFGDPLEDGTREARWVFTPLLFAKSYDVEIARDPSFINRKQNKTETPTASAVLEPGDHYWRARARDEKGYVISDWSGAQKITVPAAPQINLTKNLNEPIRRPAQTEKTKTKIKEVEKDDWQKSGWWAWLGSGMNYVDYRQSVPGRGTLASHNPKGPSQYFEGGYTGKNGIGGIISYKNTPGELVFDADQSVSIDNAAYSWSTVGIEGVVRRRSGISMMRTPVIYGLRMGVQQHKTPFVFLDADTGLQLKENRMNTASFGIMSEWSRRKWTYYWLMRYQYPFSSKAEGSNRFEITPTFAFDGSIGTSYSIGKQVKLGLFWYGQWHQYDFVYADPDVTNEGFQSLFYSNIDVRLGIDF